MKILIVGTHRSGTTSLLRGISEQGYNKISEPFNRRFRDKLYDYPIDEVRANKFICVKSIITQVPNTENRNPIKFYYQWSKDFDKTILLDRLDESEHWLSYCNLLNKTFNSGSDKLHDSWYKEEITSDVEEKLISSGYKEELKKEKVFINELSETLKIPITYYENLFSFDRDHSLRTINEMGLFLNSIKLLNYLDPNKKYMRLGRKTMI